MPATAVADSLGLRGRGLLGKAGAFPGMENVNSLPLDYHNFEIKGFSGKDMIIGIAAL